MDTPFDMLCLKKTMFPRHRPHALVVSPVILGEIPMAPGPAPSVISPSHGGLDDKCIAASNGVSETLPSSNKTLQRLHWMTQRLFSTGHMALVCFSSSPPGYGKIISATAQSPYMILPRLPGLTKNTCCRNQRMMFSSRTFKAKRKTHPEGENLNAARILYQAAF